MNQLVRFKGTEPSSWEVALVAFVFLCKIISLLDVQTFCPFYSWLFHGFALSPQYDKKV